MRARIARTRGAAALIVVVGALATLVAAAPAGAATATATFTAGSLGFVSTPPDVTFSATLNGLDQNATTTQAIDVGDATGSGTGWNLTATSTTFANGSHTLSTAATSIQSAPTPVCDSNATCNAASPTAAVTYPYSLPAANTAPTATKMFNAAANSGMGNQKVTPTWSLAVPASAYSGSYTSTWTISLVSAP